MNSPSFGAANSTFKRMLRIALVLLCAFPQVTDVGHAAVRGGIGNSVDPESGDALPEYKIKAAFLYNFIRYSSWPKEAFEDEKAPIEVLVVGSNPFQSTLVKTFAGKTLHDRKIVVRHSPLLPKEIDAHLVFSTELTEKENASLLRMCKRKGTFLIGDWKGFAERGACANFYVEDRKVRFQVNTGETKARGIEISSQLLKLATIVKTNPKLVPKDTARGAGR